MSRRVTVTVQITVDERPALARLERFYGNLTELIGVTRLVRYQRAMAARTL